MKDYAVFKTPAPELAIMGRLLAAGVSLGSGFTGLVLACIVAIAAGSWAIALTGLTFGIPLTLGFSLFRSAVHDANLLFGPF